MSHRDGVGECPLRRCVARELNEELGLTLESVPPIVGVIADPATNVGMHHLAVVFDVSVSWSEIRFDRSHDRDEFTYSNSSGFHSLKTPEDIAQVSGKLDPWSSLFLASDTGYQVLGNRIHVGTDRQMYFSFGT